MMMQMHFRGCSILLVWALLQQEASALPDRGQMQLQARRYAIQLCVVTRITGTCSALGVQHQHMVLILRGRLAMFLSSTDFQGH